MKKWEAEKNGYTCNDCYFSMQNCHDMSICCEDETGLCDWFEKCQMKEVNRMDDLISRQAAIDALTAYMGSNYMMGIVQCIERLPSAQPEITHCSECTHWKHSLARKSYCEVHDWMSKAEDFCSFAERG